MSLGLDKEISPLNHSRHPSTRWRATPLQVMLLFTEKRQAGTRRNVSDEPSVALHPLWRREGVTSALPRLKHPLADQRAGPRSAASLAPEMAVEGELPWVMSRLKATPSPPRMGPFPRKPHQCRTWIGPLLRRKRPGSRLMGNIKSTIPPARRIFCQMAFPRNPG